MVKGMGGAMDLVAGVEARRRASWSTRQAKEANRSCCSECNLPLTGAGVVDLVITDLGVFSIDKKGGCGMTLIELADGVTVDEIKGKTQAEFRVALEGKQSSAA